MVGIKGTGMTALAEVLKSRGLKVSGSDVEDVFYTDSILKAEGIPFYKGFAVQNILDYIKTAGGVDLVVYSAAYDPKVHSELIAAVDRNIPVIEYTEALGALSLDITAGAVSGVHGKTTTTAIAGSLVKALGLPGSVLAGSGVTGFGNRSTLLQGRDFLIAETCEYRRHFLRFHPDHMIVTSIEPDHLDYFNGFDDILRAFEDFVKLLPPRGSLIYCADDDGASLLARKAAEDRPDLRMVPYGFKADGPYKITGHHQIPGHNQFTLAGWDIDFDLKIPGVHTVLDTAAALALVAAVAGIPVPPRDRAVLEKCKAGVRDFAGSRRRSEILGEARGVLFMDDYAHHPSAVKTTLKGLKEFYPRRRLVVDFMSHTYSRTAGLFDGFCRAFNDADVLILHKIYGSARETDGDAEGFVIAGSGGETITVTGENLFKGVRRVSKEISSNIFYYHEIMDAQDFLTDFLKEGDLFITMGAGNNWTLGRDLYQHRLGE